MIPVSDELKQAVIHEVMPKNVVLDLGYRDIEGFNWYDEEYTPLPQYSTTISHGVSVNLDNFSKFKPSDGKVDYTYIKDRKWACFSFECKMNRIYSDSKFFFRTSHRRENGSYYTTDSSMFDFSDFSDYTRITIQIPNYTDNPTEYLYQFWLVYWQGEDNVDINFSIRKPQICFYDVKNEYPNYYDVIFATPTNVEEYFNPNYAPIDNNNIISQSFIFKESICSSDTLKFGLCEASEIDIDIFDRNYDLTGRKMDLSLQFANIQDKFEWKNFIIAESKKSYAGDIQKRHIVAYDKLKDLNGNAYAWYTQYMWGINVSRSETYYPYMFDYPRQIFSTYWNLANKFGIDSEDYITKDDLGYHPFAGAELTENRDLIYIDETVNDHYLRFYGGLFSRSSFGDNDAFIVTVGLVGNRKAGSEYARYLEVYDSLGRGIESANVLLEFVIDGETKTINYLCDSGDVVLPPANWTGVHIFAPSHLSITSDHETMANGFYLNGVKFDYLNALDLVNGTQWLPYFSYVWRKPTTENIFKADSSITARDVMRSLMEMCGCFFRLDREGHPQFLYAMEHGLYPSNTLFPADDLFPRKSSELTMPTSYYIKANFEEYRVSNFGGVQVVVNTYDSQGAVVRWEYWGDETSDNAYLIDDNIFLCNSQFEYEPQMAGNVQELLENLWNVLNNMSYTPFTAETIGTPFLESGDRFTLLTKTDGFESFIFERTLKGIQVLKDYYEARGVAKTPRVKNFEWGNTNE